MNDTSPLIDAQEVQRLISQLNVVVVDARGGADARERFRKGHVTGAVFFDLETDLSEKTGDPASGGRHPIPDVQRFARLLGRAGIAPITRIIVYDDKAGANSAARFWWMMKAMGHEKIQVVDGGLAALQHAGLPTSTDDPSWPAPKPPYPATGWLWPVANLETVDEVRSNREWLVIDVRENYRYNGESEPIDLIAGHIPGAVNMPYTDNLEATGKFRSPEALAETFRKAIGDRDADKVIIHCGSGVTACHSILAMEAAGLRRPVLYVGSWSEWSRNDKPIARFENPK